MYSRTKFRRNLSKKLPPNLIPMYVDSQNPRQSLAPILSRKEDKWWTKGKNHENIRKKGKAKQKRNTEKRWFGQRRAACLSNTTNAKRKRKGLKTRDIYENNNIWKHEEIHETPQRHFQYRLSLSGCYAIGPCAMPSPDTCQFVAASEGVLSGSSLSY